MHRRQFLKWQLQGALWLAAGSNLSLAERVMAEAPPDVAMAQGKPGPATRAAVELLGGMKSFVKEGQKVVIKPNMSFPQPPERATTTHPEVVRELVAMCKEAGASKVLVLDHPLGSQEGLCLELSGIRDSCKLFGEKMVFGLADPKFYAAAKIDKGQQMRATDIAKDVLEADVLIAAPVAKSHSSTGVSLSMKGMMGLIWDRGVMHNRYDLDTAIVDLCSVLKPKLAVIDATRVLSTNGPGGPGLVLNKNTVIASADMVAADASAVELSDWYGQKLQPRQVKHIRLAHERGLGRMDIENLNVKRVTV